MTGAGAVRCAKATAERWPDLEHLFGEHGACGGCWCMWYRLPKAGYEAGKGDTNRERLRDRVCDEALPAPGVLAYLGETPVGWCAVADRDEYRRLEATRTMRGPDDLAVWAILCLYVDPGARRCGVSVRLIDAACQHAYEHGAPAVEAYPVISRRDTVPPVFASQGLLTAYEAAGFRMVARPSKSRAVVRRYAPGP